MVRHESAAPWKSRAKATVGLLALLLLTSATIGPLHSGDDKKADNAPKDKKNTLEEFGKKLKQQLDADAPPAWKARTDLRDDPLPAGVLARLGTARFRHGSSIPHIVYSPDGKLLASGGSDSKIRIFDAATGKELRQLEGHDKSTFVLPQKPGLADFGAPAGVQGPITALAFAPDSKVLASGSWDDAIRLWDATTGKLLRRIDGHQSQVSAVAFSRDGKVLASRGGLDGVVRLWDAVTSKELHKFDNLSRRSAALALSPDSKTVVIGDGQAIVLRDVASGKETGQLKQGRCLCVAYSPDGKLLAAGGGDNTLRIWDVATATELCQCALPKKEPPGQLAFSPDSKLLAAAVKENKALIFDTATGMPTYILSHYWPDCVAFAPDGKTLATAGEPAAIRLWDPATGKEQAMESAGHQAAVTHVALSADGKTLATGGDDLRLWEGGGKLLRRIDVAGGYVEAMAVAPDGKTVATGGRDKMVRLWDTDSGKETQSFKHEGTLRALAFAPNGKTLASGDLQLNVRLWDLTTQKEAQKIKLQGTFTDRLSLVFSPDSKVLACGGAVNADFPRGIPSTDPMSFSLPDKGYPVLLWDAGTAKELGRLEGLTSRIRSVVFAPDGKVLAAASSDGRISLWDVNDSKEKLSITAHPDNVDSSFRSSPSLAFGPDGKTLVSTSTDKTLRLWDAVTGKERGRLEARSRLFAVASDGKTVVTGQADGTALVWDLFYLASARPAAKRNFSIGHIDLR